MPRPKRTLHATALATTTPPPSLPTGHSLARVIKAAGNNLYAIQYPSPTTSSLPTSPAQPPADDTSTLVELPARFRSTIWLKRGSYVVVDRAAFADRENKLGGEIVNVVREERQWRKMGYWPKEWEKRVEVDEDDSEGESVVGKMPPSDSDDEM